MDKYAQMKRFHHDCQLQAYMYASMYVDTQTIPVEEHLTATIFFVNYKKMSTPEQVPKNCLGFSYIHSEYYELDLNFEDT